MYGLKEKHIEAIHSVFRKSLEIDQAILYGSRAKGNYRNGSDIDLTLKGKDLSLYQLFKIETELDDLLLPYKIDLSIYNRIENLDLLEHIKKVGIVFFQKKEVGSTWKEGIITDINEIAMGQSPNGKRCNTIRDGLPSLNDPTDFDRKKSSSIEKNVMIKVHKLDNPAWNSLNEIHKDFSIAYKAIKFYHPAYCAFGGAIDKEIATKGISDYSTQIDDFFVIGEKPLLSGSVILKRNLICNQMLLKTPIKMELKEAIIPLKAEKQRQDLFDLVNLVQPGYFKQKTADLGTYFGIYKGNTLVAVSGERMKMNEFTEISAIVTHPEHRGNAYAKQLIKHTTDQVFQENKMPYLHVVESNIHAIQLYEKLGFTTRRKISFWNLSLK